MTILSRHLVTRDMLISSATGVWTRAAVRSEGR
jgi:hypothetical protein